MALSAKQRAKAYRARQKVQPFADKHFHGMHEATIEQFLHATKVNEKEFKAMFAEELGTPRTAEEIWKSYVKNEVFAHDAAAAELWQDKTTIAKIQIEAKRNLHSQGYFEGLSDYEEALYYEIDQLVKSAVTTEDIKRQLNKAWDALSPEEAELEVQEAIEYEGQEQEMPLGTTSYPVIDLLEAYKKLLSLP